MATFYGGWSGNLRTRMELWASSQSIPNNNSVVKQELWLETRNSAYFEDTTVRRMSIDGVSTGSVTNRRYWAPGNTRALSGQRTVGHASNGTKTVRGITDFEAVYTGFIDQTINQTLALPTIARASIPSSGNFTTGSATTINMNRKSSSFTHTVTYKIGSLTGTISSSAGASVSWTPPHSLTAAFPSATSGTVTITVVTKNGSTTVGTNKMNKTLTAGSAVVPSVGGVTWSDDNTTIRNNIGAFVQGKSLVKGTLTGVSGTHGSTVANTGTARRTIVDGFESAQGTVFQINKSGTITASGKVIDSRGRVGTKTANFSQLAYTNPQIVRLSAFRANSSGTPTANGTYIRLNIRTVIKTLIVGSEKNSTTIAIRTRPVNGGWTNRTSKTGTLVYDQTSTPIQGGTGADNFLASTSYEIEVTLTDKTGTSVTQTTSVSTAAVTFDMNGTSVGIGKMHEQGALDVGGSVYSDGLRLAGFHAPNRDASALPSTYPNGMSNFTANGTGWPNTWGTVLTIKGSNNRGMQLNFSQNGDGVRMRHMVNSSGANSWGAWSAIALSSQLPGSATETVAGLIERATQAETNAGSDNTRAVTPSRLRNRDYAPYAMAAGLLGSVTVAAGAVRSHTVTFPVGRFAHPPRVSSTIEGDARDITTTIQNITATSFTLNRGSVSVASRGGIRAHWIAVQMSSGSGTG